LTTLEAQALADEAERESLRKRADAALAALDDFPALVDRHLEITGKSASAFGRSVQSADFVRLLKARRDFGLSTIRRALQHIRAS
jgi:hypothetical protein